MKVNQTQIYQQVNQLQNKVNEFIIQDPNQKQQEEIDALKLKTQPLTNNQDEYVIDKPLKTNIILLDDSIQPYIQFSNTENVASISLEDNLIVIDNQLNVPSVLLKKEDKTDIIVDYDYLNDKMNNFNGIVDQTKFQALYTAGNRTLLIRYSTGAAYYVGGKLYEQTPSEVYYQHGTEIGLWYFYVDETNTFQISQTPWDIILHTPFYVVYYNGTQGLLFNELHPGGQNSMSMATHKNLHLTRGTQLLNGCQITQGSGISWTSTQGQIADEDLILDVAAVDGPAYRIVYLTGADTWNWQDISENGIYTDGTDPYYNQLDTGTYQLTPITSNAFFNYYVLAVSTLNAPQILVIMGQQLYANQNLASSAKFSDEIKELGFLIIEGVILYKIIYQRVGSNVNLINIQQIIQSLVVSGISSTIQAQSVLVDTTNFANTLTILDNNVQEALETIDSKMLNNTQTITNNIETTSLQCNSYKVKPEGQSYRFLFGIRYVEWDTMWRASFEMQTEFTSQLIVRGQNNSCILNFVSRELDQLKRYKIEYTAFNEVLEDQYFGWLQTDSTWTIKPKLNVGELMNTKAFLQFIRSGINDSALFYYKTNDGIDYVELNRDFKALDFRSTNYQSVETELDKIQNISIIDNKTQNNDDLTIYNETGPQLILKTDTSQSQIQFDKVNDRINIDKALQIKDYLFITQTGTSAVNLYFGLNQNINWFDNLFRFSHGQYVQNQIIIDHITKPTLQLKRDDDRTDISYDGLNVNFESGIKINGQNVIDYEVPPSTSGNVLTSDGTNWISSAPIGNVDLSITTDNIKCGKTSLSALTTGENNFVFGHNNLNKLTTGTKCIAIGRYNQQEKVTQFGDISIGHLALSHGQYTFDNVAIGENAMQLCRGNSTLNSGCRNICIGKNTLSKALGNFNETIGNNVVIGVDAVSVGTSNNIGANVCIGWEAGKNVNSYCNVLVGQRAGHTYTTGQFNCIYGTNSVGSAVGNTYENVFGCSLTGKGANTTFIGGSVGVYNQADSSTFLTTSDQRVKKNIEPYTKGLNEIMQLQIKQFNYKTKEECPEFIHNEMTTKKMYGQIAQYVQTIFPEAINTNQEGLLSIQYDSIYQAMINAIQELYIEGSIGEIITGSIIQPPTRRGRIIKKCNGQTLDRIIYNEFYVFNNNSDIMPNILDLVTNVYGYYMIVK